MHRWIGTNARGRDGALRQCVRESERRPAVARVAAASAHVAAFPRRRRAARRVHLLAAALIQQQLASATLLQRIRYCTTTFTSCAQEVLESNIQISIDRQQFEVLRISE